jgi:CRISP-associated protein Cas1
MPWEYDPEFVSYEHVQFTDWEDYKASSIKWERQADFKIRNFDTAVFGGQGLVMKVINGSLSVEYQRSHDNARMLKLNRGVHKIKTIIVSSQHGYITLDAITWLCQQGITLYLIDWKGEFLQTLTPRQNRNARLCYLQVKAAESDLRVDIAREFVYRKTLAHIEVLKSISEYTYKRTFRKYRASRTWDKPAWEALESMLEELPNTREMNAVLMLEARLAMIYWNTFVGIPIKFETKAAKIVPEHWLSITERMSGLSQNTSHATNPFHAALNFAYALLEAQVMQAINVAGLEPTVGFLHAYQDGKPSLAYDLMECFRALVDAKVLEFFQNNTFSKGDFVQWYTGECRLNEELRRYILASCRLDHVQIDQQCRWLRALLES